VGWLGECSHTRLNLGSSVMRSSTTTFGTLDPRFEVEQPPLPPKPKTEEEGRAFPYFRSTESSARVWNRFLSQRTSPKSFDSSLAMNITQLLRSVKSARNG
jgi:hypothetical protein